ncbi:MAG: hypothetical protein HC804_11440, partial [Anaerolineae bacterium]|nr:hypothetical protein [Anaerolineae bacterium]
LTPIIPFLEELQKEGESGRNKINRYTYYLTVPLAFLQAIGQIRLVGFSLGAGGLEYIMPNFGFEAGQILPTLTTLFAMLGGTMFAIWLGELITEDGIGQGISLIILAVLWLVFCRGWHPFLRQTIQRHKRYLSCWRLS